MSDSEKIGYLGLLVYAGFIISGCYFLAAGVVFIFFLDLLSKITKKRESHEKQ